MSIEKAESMLNELVVDAKQDDNEKQEKRLVKFGDCLEEFLFSPGLINLNHGSYGSTPKYVLQELHRIQYEIESCPDRWYRRENRPRWLASLADLANFLKLDDDQNIVFVQNTTTGINSILKSYPYQRGDGVAVCSLGYNAIINTVRAVTQYHSDKDVQMHTVSVTFPITDVETDVVAKFRKCFEENRNIKIAIIDHITSGTACLLPVAELIALCDEFGVVSVIDGAHAAGQILHLDIQALAPHFYAGSLHKWCYASKGCGFLWRAPVRPVRPGRGAGEWLRPLVTSHFHPLPTREQFFMQGTRSDGSYLTITPAIRFINDMCGGLERIHAYNTRLLDEACEMLVAAWGTHMLATPDSMRAPFLRMVALPHMPDYPPTDASSVDLTHALYTHHQMTALVLCVQGCLFVRLSGQIFNTFSDYDTLAGVIQKYSTPSAKLPIQIPATDFYHPRFVYK